MSALIRGHSTSQVRRNARSGLMAPIHQKRSGVRSQSSDWTWRRTSARNRGDPFAGASVSERHRRPRLEPLADEPAHAAAQAGRGVADADPAGVDRAEAHRRAGREAVGEPQTVGARQEAGHGVRLEIHMLTIREPAATPADP